MKKTWLAVGIGCTVAIGLAASTVATQEQDCWLSQRTSALLVQRMERRLNLTDAQRDQIKTILNTERPTILALASRAQEEQKELQSRTSFDEASIREFAQQHESTIEDVLVERERVRIEIRQVLTPAQRIQLQQLRQEMASRFFARLTTLGDL